MPKYKRRPTVVDAFQWKGYDPKTNPKWFVEAMTETAPDAIGAVRVVNNDLVKIITLTGIATAVKNDFIIKGPKGEIYPCKPDIFTMLHEEAD